MALLDGDDAVLADLVHYLGDDLADLGSAALIDATAAICARLDGPGDPLDLVHDLHRLDPALDLHRVGAGGDRSEGRR